jgi:hypothetical protein
MCKGDPINNSIFQIVSMGRADSRNLCCGIKLQYTWSLDQQVFFKLVTFPPFYYKTRLKILPVLTPDHLLVYCICLLNKLNKTKNNNNNNNNAKIRELKITIGRLGFFREHLVFELYWNVSSFRQN